ncbi:SDR family NAD(P)-dependent oxidoreductase [Brachybacterium huguangmaarense]
MTTDAPAVSRTTILVTGTSSGMGLHTAVELASRGCDVVATVRSEGRADVLREAARGRGVELDVRILEVTDHDAGRALVDAVVHDHGRLDVLVNNAGRGCVGTAEDLSMKTIREQLEVNYLSVVALTRAALPHMRAQGSGTILTVTSVGGAVGQPFADAYCGAKLAVEGFMQSLAPVALAHGVRVGVIEPAAVATEFVGSVERAGGEDSPYAAQLQAYLDRTAGAFAAAQSAESAAVAITDAAPAEEYRFRHKTGEAARAFAGRSLAGLDGSAVLAMTSTWIA